LGSHGEVHAHPELTNILYSESETGWVIKESSISGAHSANANITYSFDDSTFTTVTDAFGNVASYLKTDFKNGASLWTTSVPELTITEISSGGVFNVYTEYKSLDTCVASVSSFGSYAIVDGNSNHMHYTGADIFLNTARMPMGSTNNVPVVTHEFGHAIGLKDIYTRKDIIMYGYSPNPITSPQSYDINGARVILGLHSNNDHVYITTYKSFSEHEKVCNICDGYMVENHNSVTYGIYTGSPSHGSKCSECNTNIYTCSKSISAGTWMKVSSKDICRTRNISCDSGHSETEKDITHTINSNNICIDCGFSGTNIWCLWVLHSWSDVIKEKISTQDQCYKTTQKCSKCKQNRELIVDAHSFGSLCTNTYCQNCDYSRPVTHDLEQYYQNASTATVCRYIKSKCKNCTFDQTIQTDVTHDYTAWSSISSSQHNRSCTDCGYVETKSHTYSNSCDTTCNDCSATHSISHTYINACDTSCNVCGLTRTITHKYINTCDTSCDVCGVTRTISHTYSGVCDTSCNVCGATRSAPAHTYKNNCDTSCNVCGAMRTISHTYSSVCDTSCNVCGAIRTASAHTYKNNCDTSCDVCGATRTISHTYSGACDTSCNVCGATRSASAHTYKNNCDTSCNVCGAARSITHKYTTYTNNGSSGHTVNCSICGVRGGTSSHLKSTSDGGHSGNLHYYIDTCSKCSYSYRWSRSCSGPPCVVPNSLPVDEK